MDKGTLYFMLCRATADLLMLPKDILMDKSVRKEVCMRYILAANGIVAHAT